MFTDMVGYTAATQSDETGALRRRAEQETLLLPVVGEHGGRKVKSTGDGVLLEFGSALKATQCAIEIQRRVRERNARSGQTPIEMRIGIHLGDVEVQDGDIFGDAVNLAARVEPLAEPGGVCLSEEVFSQVRNKIPVTMEKLPAQDLKGVRFPVTVYRVRMPWTAPDGPASPGDSQRLAVLPFANFSPDPHDEYFADGLTDELITVLAQLQSVRVVARTSVFQYKGTTKTVAQIGSELDVASVLEGSVRKSDGRIRVTAQLIDVRTQDHTWAESYDRNLSDVLEVQSDVAKEVAKALKVRIRSPDARGPEGNRPVQSESYLAYLRGRALFLESFSEPNLKEAQWQFERAVSLDPSNARAYAGLSEATHLLGLFYGRRSKSENLRAARQFAERAIELDPGLAEGHSALGLVLYDDLEWDGAEQEALVALGLNPSYSTARLWYSLLLQEEGRVDDALSQMREAYALDPQSRQICGLYTFLLLVLERTAEVEPVLEKLRSLDPTGHEYHMFRGWTLYLRGDVDGAFREIALGESCPADRPGGRVGASYERAQLYALTGQKDRARALIAEIPPAPELAHPLMDRAITYGYLGDLDECFRLLNEQYDIGHGMPLQRVRLDPSLKALRADSRFAALLKLTKIPEAYRGTDP